MSQITNSCENADAVESLYGVYLLYSVNPRYKGRTYIGYTVNPKRRISQHNKGHLFGGARRTNNRGPWEMVLIVHGFPNDISALRWWLREEIHMTNIHANVLLYQPSGKLVKVIHSYSPLKDEEFEWAWQHPERSRRLRTIERKKSNETQFQYRLRVLQEMLHTGPWSKLPLTVRWLEDQYQLNSKVDLCPPIHMPIATGPVYPKKPGSEDKSVETSASCSLCSRTVSSEDRVSCVVPSCTMVAHIRCLARNFIQESEDVLPVEGICPKCSFSLLWGDLVRNKIIESSQNIS